MKNILSLFKKTDELESIKNELSHLRTKLENIDRMENKIDALIHLFQTVSFLQDKNTLKETILELKIKNSNGSFNKKIAALRAIVKHITNAGRDIYGMNRTKVGETVTAEKVFLGDIFGLWTKPAHYWLTSQEKLENEKMLVPEIDTQKPVSIWYIINDYQAGTFVQSHTQGLLKHLSVLDL